MSLLEWCRNWKARKSEEAVQEIETDSGECERTCESDQIKDSSVESNNMQIVEGSASAIQPKAVLVDGEKYDSIKSASKVIGCSANALGNHLRKGDENYMGHSISYA